MGNIPVKNITHTSTLCTPHRRRITLVYSLVLACPLSLIFLMNHDEKGGEHHGKK